MYILIMYIISVYDSCSSHTLSIFPIPRFYIYYIHFILKLDYVIRYDAIK